MSFAYEDNVRSAETIRTVIGDFKPEILLILGTDLGFLGDEVENPVYIRYENIPNFALSTVQGHAGHLVFGKLCGRNVAVMQGRVHGYEGYSSEQVAYPVRVLKLLGADTLLVTNAAGAINREYKPGDLMVIRDHIRLMGTSPLMGPNIDAFGERFPDMSKLYTQNLRLLARKVGEKLGVTMHEGVYMYFQGPQFETPAEIYAASVLGADAAGMSTVPETITACHCGMKVLGISLCTNMAAGLQAELSAAEVGITAGKSRDNVRRLVLGILEEM